MEPNMWKDAALTAEELLNAAREASKNAYAPYSTLSVGAALLSAQGNVYSGCNVENVSYPIGSCAERNAIATAVRIEGGSFKLKAVAVAAEDSSGHSVAVSPCGACRQAIKEFGGDALVIFTDPTGSVGQYAIQDLLPHAFSFPVKKTSN